MDLVIISFYVGMPMCNCAEGSASNLFIEWMTAPVVAEGGQVCAGKKFSICLHMHLQIVESLCNRMFVAGAFKVAMGNQMWLVVELSALMSEGVLGFVTESVCCILVECLRNW